MRLPLLAVVAVTALAAADPDATPTITILPKQVEQTTTIDFDTSGNYRKASDRLRIACWLQPPAGTQIIAVTQVRIDKALTEAGESLLPKESDDNGSESFSEWERREAKYDIDFTIAPATKPAAKIALEGTVMARIVYGKEITARFMPLHDFLGKTVVLEGLNLEATLTRHQDGIRLGASEELLNALLSARALSARNTEIKVQGSSYSHSGDEPHHIWRAEVPDDGGMELRFAAHARLVSLPFSFKALPLRKQAVTTATTTGRPVLKTSESAPAPVKPKRNNEEE